MEDKEFLELHNGIMSAAVGVMPEAKMDNGISKADAFAMDNTASDTAAINNTENVINNMQESAELANMAAVPSKDFLEDISQSDTMKAFRRSNAYKMYNYTGEETVTEARKMSQVLSIPENVVMFSPETLNKTRDIYKTFEKTKDINKVYERFPG